MIAAPPVLTVDLRWAARASGTASLHARLAVPVGVTALTGVSGAGKSTLLALISGVQRDGVGQVRLGETVWQDNARGVWLPPEQRRVGHVFQTPLLFPHRTVLDNVAFGLAPGLDRAARAERALAALQRMQASHLAGRWPRSLSGGEAQRVALARALATQPRMLLLDEAFSALDGAARESLIAETIAWAAELAAPVLYVTHHLAEAQQVAGRVCVLADGTVR